MTTISSAGTAALQDLSNAARAGSPTATDVNSLVQWALRESYLSGAQDLQIFAEKVKFYNSLKKEIRDELSRLRTVQSTIAGCYKEDGSVDLEKLQNLAPPNHTGPDGQDYSNQGDPGWGTSADGLGGARRWVDEQLRPGWGNGGGVASFSDVPGPNGEVVKNAGGTDADQWWTAGGKDRLDTALKNLEEKLNGVGDDAQLANTDLQNALQRMQQTMQAYSNISKQVHDTMLAIIRKIGG